QGAELLVEEAALVLVFLLGLDLLPFRIDLGLAGDRIVAVAQPFQGVGGWLVLDEVADAGRDEALRVQVHEIAHALVAAEGFAQGGDDRGVHGRSSVTIPYRTAPTGRPGDFVNAPLRALTAGATTRRSAA